jgi:WhiB family redox-sensing transcriptional regulator
MAIKKSTKREIQLKELYTGQAKCEEIGDHIFFPEFDTEEKDKEELYKETMFAKSICASCPLLKKCRDYGLQNRVYGIWGGMGYYERTQYWRKNKIIPKDVFI